MIGIAGGIGSGKSVVSRILRLKGHAVYDCDLEAKRIMDNSEEVLTALNSRFGDEVCPAGGPISRPALAEKVFGEEIHRIWLNSLVHRLVREDLAKWEIERKASGAGPCFVESAIMASSGLASLCSEIWIVTAPEETRISRASARDKASAEMIQGRIRSQRREEEMLRSMPIPIRWIDNSGEGPLLPQMS